MAKRKKNKRQSLRQHFFRFFFFALFFLGWEKSAFALVFCRFLRRLGVFEGGISVLRRLSIGFAAVWRGVIFLCVIVAAFADSLAGKEAGQADGGLEALEVLAAGDFYGAELLGDGR